MGILEDSLKELDAILKLMDKPNISLDDATELFNKAVVLSKSCIDKLDKSKGKLKQLTAELEELDLDVETEE